MSKLVVRPGVKDAPLYIPGGHEVAGNIKPAILSANENPLGPGAAACAAYRHAADHLFRYPEGGATKLRDAIGARFNLDPGRIICGAGSDELLTFITRIFAGPGDEIVYSRHGFMMYPINAIQVGATPVAAPENNLTTDVDALLAAVTDKTRLVFVANPNNPTGSFISAAEMTRLADGLPENIVLVIDAAYAEYVSKKDYNPGIELVASRNNVIMTRTFSKLFGLAALRLGWCYCSDEVAALMNRLRGPFNINAPAQAAGIAAVGDLSHGEKSKAHNDRFLKSLGDGLRALGIDVPPSVGNFLLAGFGDEETASLAYDYLLSKAVIGRAMGGYGLPSYIRLTIGLEEECQRVLDSLRAFKG